MNVTGKNLKTIATNLQAELIDDVLQFHNKSNLCLDANFIKRMVQYSFTYNEAIALERSDYEISPFHGDSIECDETHEIKIKRDKSAKGFGTEAIEFSTIKTLLKHSFSVQKNTRRPYPSGGALYPVEVICIIFSEKIKSAPESGFYHYRPTKNILQPLALKNSEAMREIIYQMEIKKVSAPAFAFLYIAVVGKMLVKYRYRGYRYALMETGSMYQQADLVAQSLGLSNKLYSGFNDHEIVKMIGLDNLNFLPLVVQSFGAPQCK